jgi:hypothetical protein
MNCQARFHRGQDPTLLTRRWFFSELSASLRDPGATAGYPRPAWNEPAVLPYRLPSMRS